MAKVMIVEDDRALSDMLEIYLVDSGFSVIKNFTGKHVLNESIAEKVDVIILDVSLPEANGFDIMKEVKNTGLPVIFLTARHALLDKLTAYNLGAEDYITKPFEPLELIAKLRVKFKEVVVINDVRIDLKKEEVTKDNLTIALTNQEFQLLKTLIENCNLVMSRDHLFQKLGEVIMMDMIELLMCI